MHKYLLLLAALFLGACQQATEEAAVEEAAIEEPASEQAGPSLAELLDAQPDDVKARYKHRHPQATLEFFGIEPGMTVAEGLPGRGWYTKVLAPYLGASGHIIGVSYSMDMWPLFPFGSEEFVQGRSTWTTDFPADAEEWRGENSATLSAYVFGSVPDEIAGTADVVFFARVLHNLANFENAGKGEFLTTALADAYSLLKPGGTFGVVQHHARDEMSDKFANGTHGYLKKDFVIARAEAAGLEFVGELDINANENDRPSEEDVVWRLPPSYNGAGDDAELRAQLDAIGESNRMTLKFLKPE
jgi:predicted methyltransferase